MAVIVGTSTSANALGLAPQTQLWFDGRYWYCFFYASGSTYPQVVYIDSDTDTAGSAHNVPNLPIISAGKAISTFLSYRFTGNYILVISNDKIEDAFKSNDSLSATGDASYATGSGFSDFCTTLIDYNDYHWYAGLIVSPGGPAVRRASGQYAVSPFESMVSLRTLILPNGTVCQLVGYENGDVGCLYTDGSSDGEESNIFYKHYNNSTSAWGSEETIAPVARAYYSFRGVVTRNDKLFCIYGSNELSGGIENLMNYTEVDSANDRITRQLPTRAKFTAIPRNQDCYLYKDFGIDYFSGDFEVWFEFTITSAAAGNYVVLWCLANDLDDNAGLENNNQSHLDFRFYYGPNIVTEEQNGANYYGTSSTTITVGTTYYVKVWRNESVGTYGTLYVKFYTSDANRISDTSPIVNHSLALHAKNDFRYMYVIQSYNNGATGGPTGWVRNYTIANGSVGNSIIKRLKYRIRSGGSWGSEGIAATDLYGIRSAIGFSACADVGKSEKVYIVYYDATNIASLEWNGTSFNNKITRVS